MSLVSSPSLSSVPLSRASPSVLLPPPSSAAPDIAPADALPALAREIAHLERRLQHLLDAQSDGLLAGLGQAPEPPLEPRPPSRSASSPPRSPSPSRQKRARDTAPAPLSLHAARAQLRSTLRRLARLRAAEADAHRAAKAPLAQFLARADELVEKKRQIEAEISKREGSSTYTPDASPSPARSSPAPRGSVRLRSSESQRLGKPSDESTKGVVALPALPALPPPSAPGAALAEAEAVLQTHVDAVSTHLSQLRVRLETVRSRRATRTSRAAAALSSWRGSLSAIDAQIADEILAGGALLATGDLGQQYLEQEKKRQGRQGAGRRAESDGASEPVEANVWALKKERRTVEMIQDEVGYEIKRLDGVAEKAETEGQACAVGAERWTAVVREVGKVEERRQQEMQGLADPESATFTRDALATERSHPARKTEDGMPSVLSLMSEVESSLMAILEEAQAKRWLLLENAVGAEAEALHEAHAMLMQALAADHGLGADAGATELADFHNKSTAKGKGPVRPPERLVDVAAESHTAEWKAHADDRAQARPAARGHESPEEREEEVDGPGPDLLVSQLDES